MLAIGFREIVSKVFYSLKDTKTPMINATIGMFLNIVLNIILSCGLALVDYFSNKYCCYIYIITLIISLRKKIGSLG